MVIDRQNVDQRKRVTLLMTTTLVTNAHLGGDRKRGLDFLISGT